MCVGMAYHTHVARINVYIPEDLEAELREAGTLFNVSGICQRALREELGLRKALAGSDFTTHELFIEEADGQYVARIVAKALAENVYVTEGGTFVLYDDTRNRIDTVEDAEVLREWLDLHTYVRVMNGLGRTPIVDLDLDRDP